MSDWTPHQGRLCPVEPETLVLIRYRNGQEAGPVKARQRRWPAWPRTIGNSAWDIVAWRKSPV